MVTTINCFCYYSYFLWTVQAGILAACQFRLHSTQELFTSSLLEPATPAAHVCNRDGQIKEVRAPGRGKKGSPHWHKRPLILIVRIIISLIYRRALVMEILWIKWAFSVINHDSLTIIWTWSPIPIRKTIWTRLLESHQVNGRTQPRRCHAEHCELCHRAESTEPTKEADPSPWNAWRTCCEGGNF